MNPEGFTEDVLREPEVLGAVLDAYSGPGSPMTELGPDRGAARRVVLIGMGSSRYAALTAATALRARGVFAVAEYASSGTPAAPGPDVLAVGISASGSTPETVAALARHRGSSRCVAVTNDPGSELAGVADVVLPLYAGRERGGVACRTFQASVAVLLMLAGVPAEALRPAVFAQRALFERRGEWLDDLVGVVEDVHTVHTLAPAERLSSALQSALMLREGPRIAAAAAETGDWLHVDVYLSKHPGYTALLFGGSQFDAGVMEWARERSSTIVAVGRPIDGAALHVAFDGAEDPWTAALVDVSVVELVAAELWRRRLSAGLMP